MITDRTVIEMIADERIARALKMIANEGHITVRGSVEAVADALAPPARPEAAREPENCRVCGGTGMGAPYCHGCGGRGYTIPGEPAAPRQPDEPVTLDRIHALVREAFLNTTITGVPTSLSVAEHVWRGLGGKGEKS